MFANYRKYFSVPTLVFDRIQNLSLVLCSFYFVLRFIDDFFLAFKGMADETAFINVLKYFLSYGYAHAVIEGTSLPLMMMSSLVYKLTNDYSLALRITSCACTFILIAFIYKRLLPNITLKRSLIFHLSILIGTTTTASIIGQSDSIFYMGFLIFFFESTICGKNKKYSIAILSFGSSIMIMSRPVVIIYLTIILAGFILYRIVTQNIKFMSHHLRVPFALIIGLIITMMANYPKIKYGDFSISYSNKVNSKPLGIKNIDLSWTEWFYISQLQGNESRFGFLAPTINVRDAEKYKKEHPEVKLPKTYREYLTHDLFFIFKRFPVSIIETCFYSLRLVGFLFVLLPFYIFNKLKKKSADRFLLYSITALIGAIVWSVLWPSTVQSKHLYPIYIITICSLLGDVKLLDQAKYFYLFILNILFIDFVMWQLKRLVKF